MWRIKGSFNGQTYVAFGDDTVARLPEGLSEALTFALAADGGVLSVTPTGPHLLVDLTNASDAVTTLAVMTAIDDTDGPFPPRLVAPLFATESLVY